MLFMSIEPVGFYSSAWMAQPALWSVFFFFFFFCFVLAYSDFSLKYWNLAIFRTFNYRLGMHMWFLGAVPTLQEGAIKIFYKLVNTHLLFSKPHRQRYSFASVRSRLHTFCYWLFGLLEVRSLTRFVVRGGDSDPAAMVVTNKPYSPINALNLSVSVGEDVFVTAVGTNIVYLPDDRPGFMGISTTCAHFHFAIIQMRLHTHSLTIPSLLLLLLFFFFVFFFLEQLHRPQYLVGGVASLQLLNQQCRRLDRYTTSMELGGWTCSRQRTT
jgi:hypothetical protein